MDGTSKVTQTGQLVGSPCVVRLSSLVYWLVSVTSKIQYGTA